MTKTSNTTVVSAEPSLCIPRVFSNITWMRVKEEIEHYGLGEVDHVDMVSRENEHGEKFQRVFIHFKEWSNTKHAQEARAKIMNGEMIQITYDEPWFWKIGRNFSTMKKTKKTDTERNDGFKVVHTRHATLRQGFQPQRIRHPQPMRMTKTPPRVRFEEQDNRPVKITNTPTYSSVVETDNSVSQLLKELRLLKITVERQSGEIEALKKELNDQKDKKDIQETNSEKSVSPPIPESLSKMLNTEGMKWCDIVEAEEATKTPETRSVYDSQEDSEDEQYLVHKGRKYEFEELDNYDDI